MQRFRVWDLPTRIFHWALVLCVIASFVTVNVGGNAMPWPGRIGLTVLGLLVFPAGVTGRPSSVMILAVGPFTAVPPTSGDTATTGTPLPRSSWRMPGTARSGSMLSQGMEGQMTMAMRSFALKAATTPGPVWRRAARIARARGPPAAAGQRPAGGIPAAGR